MTAIHYHLETRSWEAAKALDRVVQSYLLSPDVARQDLTRLGIAAPTAPTDAPVQSDVVTVFSPTSLETRAVVSEPRYDVNAFSTFDALYHEHRQLSRRHRSWYLFGSVVPERVRIDLVVDASEGYTRALHAQIARADVQLIDRRAVNNATFIAETRLHGSGRIADFSELIDVLAEEEYPQINLQTRTRTDRDTGTGRLNLMVYGPIPDVIAFRRSVLREGLPATIGENEITFEARTHTDEEA